MCVSKICSGKDIPNWISDFSFSLSHGLNYHLDGNKTLYWDETSSIYRINRSTSWAVSYKLSQKVSLSMIHERFSGLYQDQESLQREDLILYRSGKNYGITISYKWHLGNRCSIAPYIGLLRRSGFEVYEFYSEIKGQLRTIELDDLGVMTGLSVHCELGKGFSLFALGDFTHFFHLKSPPLNERDFYDGPTPNYIRTRLGIEYSLSHILKPKG